jgi:Uma2 family endonuclease
MSVLSYTVGMTATRGKPPARRTIADLHRRLGKIALERIHLSPYPGLAQADDLHRRPSKPLCELIDHVIVEKAMGARESFLAGWLLTFLNPVVARRDLGVCLTADGMIRLGPGTIRLPDVCFIPWSQFPGRVLPTEPSWNVVPALIVEVRSPSNTDGEIALKLKQFFARGTKLAWVIDPSTRTAVESTAAGIEKSITVLNGRRIVPGFKLPLAELFALLGPKSAHD